MSRGGKDAAEEEREGGRRLRRMMRKRIRVAIVRAGGGEREWKSGRWGTRSTMQATANAGGGGTPKRREIRRNQGFILFYFIILSKLGEMRDLIYRTERSPVHRPYFPVHTTCRSISALWHMNGSKLDRSTNWWAIRPINRYKIWRSRMSLHLTFFFLSLLFTIFFTIDNFFFLIVFIIYYLFFP